jgi:hypothetical protein
MIQTPAVPIVAMESFFSKPFSDALVRASSLSNLGEVCKNLRFSIGGMAHDVKTLRKTNSFLILVF